MKLTTLDLFIPVHEAATHARKMLAKISALQDATAELVDGGVIARGSVNLGLSVPFEARWRVATVATNEVVITLEHLKASVFGMGGGAMTDALMKLLAKKLEGVAGVRVEGNAIHADAAVVLKQYGVELRGKIKTLSITCEGVVLQVVES